MGRKSVGLRNECRWREGAEVNAPQNLRQTERAWKTAGMKQRKYMNEKEAETDRTFPSQTRVRKWQRGEPAETFPFVAFKNGVPLRRDALREAASNLPKRMRKVAAELYRDGQVSKRLQENKVPQKHQAQGFACSE